jgi:hypothetical protein
MNFRYTKQQVARGTLPDAEKGNEVHLFKNVSKLRATHQIRLHFFRASEEGRTLVLHVPERCVFDVALTTLIDEFSKNVRVLRV